MENTIKIGNTDFSIDAVKAMKEEEFVKLYREILKGQDCKKVYKQIIKADGPDMG